MLDKCEIGMFLAQCVVLQIQVADFILKLTVE